MKFINKIVDVLCKGIVKIEHVTDSILSVILLFIVLFGVPIIFALFTVIPWGLGIAQMFRSLFG